MFEIKGELWALPADVICITTNGTIKKDGTCVMGRGCAQEARDTFPGIDKILGDKIIEHGNHVHELGSYETGTTNNPLGHTLLWSFPVKHNWFETADLDLIARSAREVVSRADLNARWIGFVAIPRPGCGNGQLEWKDVRPVLEDILDDRFGVVFK